MPISWRKYRQRLSDGCEYESQMFTGRAGTPLTCYDEVNIETPSRHVEKIGHAQFTKPKIALKIRPPFSANSEAMSSVGLSKSQPETFLLKPGSHSRFMGQFEPRPHSNPRFLKVETMAIACFAVTLPASHSICA